MTRPGPPPPTVAVTADRRRDEQAVLLERQGFEVRMYPLLTALAEDPAELRRMTEETSLSPPDYLLANTGFGMRTWFELGAQWGLLEGLVSALKARTAIAARGAKAVGELRKNGLEVWYRAPGETLEEVVGRLVQEDLSGRSVLVQLHGERGDPAAPLVNFARPGAGAANVFSPLGRAGAAVAYLPVYITGVAGGDAASRLVQAICSHDVDVVTFTAAPQVQALTAAARANGELDRLLGAFNSADVVAACIGHVCAAAAEAAGIAQPLVPEHPRLGSLASALGERFRPRP